ncbi:MAG TPA: GNAT family N-acetyltransferase [Beijerinckiaceae bacterium]|nr:GNAT family N-acetyltransferase [Beijerinckiaceae bacterium]
METFTALAGPAGVLAAPRAGPAFRLDVVSDVRALEDIWRELETAGVASPYQRFDWVTTYVASHREMAGFEAWFVVVRDRAAEPLVLLPLEIRRSAAGRIADVVGGKHANFHAPLLRAGAAREIGPAEMRAVLMDAGRQIGLDAYAFTNLPVAWRGEPNPLAIGGRPSPSNGYKLTLAGDAETTLGRAFSKDTRKKLRRKEKALAEIGPVAHRVARSPSEADAMLDTFLDLKRARFRELGIANPFEEPETERFLRAASRAGLARGAPALELHALVVGERLVAIFGAATDATRCSGMMIAFDPEPAVARTSPGDLLLTHVVRAQCLAGRETFDLGVGEARYKNSLCDETEELVDVALPVTWRGRLHAAAAGAYGSAKHRVKQTPWMWGAVAAARRLKARAGAGSG